eukprot:CAMPEP_0198151808 /NCGR_PEP_ID=MMETSP1443-20131203/57176_1 /TAXON_ID=186043 /ORGANISM="Entomoneis sp., Strain CCMP2396" /LENGTH=175 /DNA_ID=CAMNT_0043817613 /DNA_START=33 /DNA_END=560 /DNA_ORIENTATION=-
MSPMHHSWSPRDFRESPLQWRQSIGGATCYSDGDVADIPNLNLTFDHSAFTMEDDIEEEYTNVAAAPQAVAVGEEAHEKLSLGGSNHSVGPTLRDAMEDSDMEFHYSPTLACDFGGAKGSALDDVVMKDIDPADDDLMSPLPFFGEADSTLLDNLPDLLQMPIPPYGHYDNKAFI